jgi:hypothetical protein
MLGDYHLVCCAIEYGLNVQYFENWDGEEMSDNFDRSVNAEVVGFHSSTQPTGGNLTMARYSILQRRGYANE